MLPILKKDPIYSAYLIHHLLCAETSLYCGEEMIFGKYHPIMQLFYCKN